MILTEVGKVLEVQLCRRSAMGAVIPIARSDDPDLVRVVARRIVSDMRRLHFTDPVLDQIGEVERDKLQRHLAMEGIENA